MRYSKQEGQDQKGRYVQCNVADFGNRLGRTGRQREPCDEKEDCPEGELPQDRTNFQGSDYRPLLRCTNSTRCFTLSTGVSGMIPCPRLKM